MPERTDHLVCYKDKTYAVCGRDLVSLPEARREYFTLPEGVSRDATIDDICCHGDGLVMRCSDVVFFPANGKTYADPRGLEVAGMASLKGKIYLLESEGEKKRIADLPGGLEPYEFSWGTPVDMYSRSRGLFFAVNNYNGEEGQPTAAIRKYYPGKDRTVTLARLWDDHIQMICSIGNIAAYVGDSNNQRVRDAITGDTIVKVNSSITAMCYEPGRMRKQKRVQARNGNVIRRAGREVRDGTW